MFEDPGVIECSEKIVIVFDSLPPRSLILRAHFLVLTLFKFMSFSKDLVHAGHCVAFIVSCTWLNQVRCQVSSLTG